MSINRKTILQLCVILTFSYIASIFLTFYFEGSYREFIRRLYIILSTGKISYHIPRKDMHFPSNLVVLSLGFFLAMQIYYIKRTHKIQSITYILLLFISTTITYSFFDSNFKLIQCTACDDLKLVLYYDDIKYDNIFVLSLILAVIPTIVYKANRQRMKKAANNS